MSVRRDIEPSIRDTSQSSGRNVIAVIGIDRYAHWPRLGNAVNDARGVAALFGQLGFEQITEPLLDERATGKATRELVNDELRGLGPNDSLVVFYAGHGSTRTDKLGRQMVKTGYLIPADASDSSASWIELSGWLRALSVLPPRHILVILDACHSGIALGPIIKWRDSGTWKDTPAATLRSRRSRRIITSALDDQTALDSGPLHGHSLFTGCVIEALTHGIAHAGQRETTGSELALYVQHRVMTHPSSEQTPDFGTFDFDERGELMIPLRTTGSHPDGIAEIAAGASPPAHSPPAHSTPAPRDPPSSRESAARPRWPRWLRGSVADKATRLLAVLALVVPSLILVVIDPAGGGAPPASESISPSQAPSSRDDRRRSNTESARSALPESIHVDVARATLVALLKERMNAGCRVLAAPQEIRGDKTNHITSRGDHCVAEIFVSATAAERLQLTLTDPLGEALPVPPPSPTVELTHCPQLVGEYTVVSHPATATPYVMAALDCDGTTMAAHGPNTAAAEAARATLAARVQSRLAAGCVMSGAPRPAMGKTSWTTTVPESARCLEHLAESSALDNPVVITVTDPAGQQLSGGPMASLTVRYCPTRTGEYTYQARPKNDAPYAVATLECPRNAREPRR
ncbi:MAG TPA: caspase family protein [Kofleriaceae bacterium]